ncbi:Domain of uncharacterised function (DUF74) [Kingella potus]|uniref:Domain of uncharacterized function (DUF74) n=1 Tax=Kingella potus TaxID=265175 RepID=A0A377R4D4_9NEIS|nr:heavy metal-binding domain-containing protein [Kingella potus]STR03351.1 Domain of uncharacterised function (DUF74) [Kingella potus]
MNQPDTASIILAAWPLWLPLILLAAAAFIGRYNAKKHLADLAEREAALAHIALISVKHPPSDFYEGELVYGSVVLSGDRFSRVIAFLRKIIGGHIGVYETLIERARREGILRMKEKAAALGADTVYNVKLDTITLSPPTQPNNGGQAGTVEILAYGTAGKTKRQAV